MEHGLKLEVIKKRKLQKRKELNVKNQNIKGEQMGFKRKKKVNISWMWSRLSKVERLIVFGLPLLLVYVFYKIFLG